MTPPPAPIVLSLTGITKRFGALLANDAVDLDLKRGEIVALLGENGAGKTTLMNILFGHYVADSGHVRIAGADGGLAELPPGEPQAALAAGIGMVHQHFTLAENLTGFENVVLGTEPLWRAGLARKGARARIETLVRETGLAVALDVPVAKLSVGEKQRLEILKALYREARVLVLDEPTAVLTPQEADGLFAVIRKLAAGGLSIVFISHKLAEVLALCDRLVVLRHGRKVADRTASGADRDLIAELMVGQKVGAPDRPPRTPGAALLQLAHVSAGEAGRRDAVRDIDFTLREGEIVGIAGVSGNGQAALAALIGGTLAPDTGTLTILGDAIAVADPRAMVARGVGRVPEDRHRDGAVAAMSIAENLALETLRDPSTQRFGFLDLGAMTRRARAAITAHDVRCPGPDARIGLLSGGNMQKVILARVLDRDPRIVLANQPTRGLDVQATSEVHRRLIAARERGAGVVLVSEDLDELFALSDRIAVMHRGQLTQALPVASLSVRAVGLMMAGQTPDMLEPVP
jgi:simple sugar transport system ATP-binding protein